MTPAAVTTPPDDAPTEASTSRGRLLESIVEQAAHNGFSDLSLRQLAAAVGTSHRMLLYHFGSKEGLLVAVIRAVEQRTREQQLAIFEQPGLSSADAMRRAWRMLTDPAIAPYERLFFELYGQALQGRRDTARLLENIVDSWLEPFTALGLRAGLDRREARANARLGVAVTRGLLLDLLATGDRAGVNAAHELFVARFTGARSPHSRTGRRHEP